MSSATKLEIGRVISEALERKASVVGLERLASDNLYDESLDELRNEGLI